MKRINIGILPQSEIRKRTLAIAKGEYKPAANEPKIWFTSMESLSKVLNDDNRALLRVIANTAPPSITALSKITDQRPRKLSRTLRTMANYGMVELKKENTRIRPIAKATEFYIVASQDLIGDYHMY